MSEAPIVRKKGNPNWVKGKSANPAGRPPLKNSMAELAREALEAKHESGVMVLQKVFKTFAELAMQGSVPHATFLCDRGYGRPVETIRTEDVTPMDDDTAAWVAFVRTKKSVKEEYLAYLKKVSREQKQIPPA